MSSDFKNDPEFGGSVAKSTTESGSGCQSCLIGFLVMVAVLGLLVALLIPAVESAKTASNRSQCVNNLKQIGLALFHYKEAYGVLPPACTVDAQGRPLHSWRTLILPFMEQEPLYSAIDLSKPWNDPVNARAAGITVNSYSCPSAMAPPKTTTYLALVGPDWCLKRDTPRSLDDITDDRHLTLAVVDVPVGYAVPWMAPIDADLGLVLSLGKGAKLHHFSGMNAAR